MSLKFTNNNDYILIQSSTGMDYWEIMEGIPKLISMPEFKNKNDIWEFKSDQIKMSYADLQKTYGILYSDICNDLQREIRVFSDLKSAENWIIK